VILERVFFPCSRFPRLEEWDLEKTAIQDLFATIYGIHPCRVSQTFEAVAANEMIAKQLRVEEGFPLLMLNRILFDPASDKPFELSQDFLRSDYARIHTELDLENPGLENPQERFSKTTSVGKEVTRIE
jgi:GntR family transcriptional regulator